MRLAERQALSLALARLLPQVKRQILQVLATLLHHIEHIVTHAVFVLGRLRPTDKTSQRLLRASQLKPTQVQLRAEALFRPFAFVVFLPVNQRSPVFRGG